MSNVCLYFLSFSSFINETSEKIDRFIDKYLNDSISGSVLFIVLLFGTLFVVRELHKHDK